MEAGENEQTRVCLKCGKERPLEEFTFKDKLRLYRTKRCLKCENEFKRVRYHERKGRDGSKAILPGWGWSEYQKRRREEKARRNAIPGKRICSKCGKLKLIKEYLFRNKETGERTAQCRECLCDYKNEMYKKHTDRYKKAELKARARSCRRVAKIAWAYLELHSCVDCGESDTVLLDFDRPRKRGRPTVVAMGNYHRSKQYVLAMLGSWTVRCATCLERKRLRESWKWHPAREAGVA